VRGEQQEARDEKCVTGAVVRGVQRVPRQAGIGTDRVEPHPRATSSDSKRETSESRGTLPYRRRTGQ
jgi:hypothetical protein